MATKKDYYMLGLKEGRASAISEAAVEGMRQGCAISASVRVWEYGGADGVWHQCRNADDACMWAEDGRRIREKLQPPAGETIRATQDGSMEAASVTAQSAVDAASTDEVLEALKAIMAQPYGCVYCDSGQLRLPPKYPHARPDQGHEADCGFAMASAAMAKAED